MFWAKPKHIQLRTAQDLGPRNERAGRHEKSLPDQGSFSRTASQALILVLTGDTQRHGFFMDSACSRLFYIPPNAATSPGYGYGFIRRALFPLYHPVKVVPAQPGRSRSTALAQP